MRLAAKTITTPSGLQIVDIKVGTGATPKTGQTCVMHYAGWLYENGQKGKKFDSSVNRGEPLEFPIGMRRAIAGWDEGVATMKVGGKRTLMPVSSTMQTLVSWTETSSPAKWSTLRFSF